MFDLHPAYSITPTPGKVGDEVLIRYHGLLAQAGADQIWLHTGYGEGAWSGINDYQMIKAGNEWEQKVIIENGGQFNFCFKDSANNWDNNNGLNWSYRIKS